MADDSTPAPIERNKRRSEFCKIEAISLSHFYELKRQGLAPEELDICGVRRITPEAHQAWREMMAARQPDATAQQRRLASARKAGRISADSPSHISQQRHARRLARKRR